MHGLCEFSNLIGSYVFNKDMSGMARQFRLVGKETVAIALQRTYQSAKYNFLLGLIHLGTSWPHPFLKAHISQLPGTVIIALCRPHFISLFVGTHSQLFPT